MGLFVYFKFSFSVFHLEHYNIIGTQIVFLFLCKLFFGFFFFLKKKK